MVKKFVFGRCLIYWEIVEGVRREWLVDVDDSFRVEDELERKYTGRWDFLHKWGFRMWDEISKEEFDRLSGEAEEFLF